MRSRGQFVFQVAVKHTIMWLIHAMTRGKFLAKLQNTLPLIYMSLNKNNVYCVNATTFKASRHM